MEQKYRAIISHLSRISRISRYCCQRVLSCTLAPLSLSHLDCTGLEVDGKVDSNVLPAVVFEKPIIYFKKEE